MADLPTPDLTSGLPITGMPDGASLQVADMICVVRTNTTKVANTVTVNNTNVHLKGSLLSAGIDYRPASVDLFTQAAGAAGATTGLSFSAASRGTKVEIAQSSTAAAGVVQMAAYTTSNPDPVFTKAPTVGNTLVVLANYWSGGSGFKPGWTTLDRNGGSDDYSQVGYRTVQAGDDVTAAAALQFGGPNGGSYVVFEISGSVVPKQSDLYFVNGAGTSPQHATTIGAGQLLIGMVSGGNSPPATVTVNSGGPIQQIASSSDTRSIVGWSSATSADVTGSISPNYGGPSGGQDFMMLPLTLGAVSTTGLHLGLRPIPAESVGQFSMVTRIDFNAAGKAGAIFGPAVATADSTGLGFIGRGWKIGTLAMPGPAGGTFAGSNLTLFPYDMGSECSWFRITVSGTIATFEFSDNGVVWNALATKDFGAPITRYGYCIRDAGYGTSAGRISYFDSSEFPNSRF